MAANDFYYDEEKTVKYQHLRNQLVKIVDDADFHFMHRLVMLASSKLGFFYQAKITLTKKRN